MALRVPSAIPMRQNAPETYPKFQKQIGRVVRLWGNHQLVYPQPGSGQGPGADDPKMVALEAYVTWERRGVALDPGKH